MTYNRDLQEDKEALFDSADTVRATVRIVTAMLGHIGVKQRWCETAAADPALLATDLAEYLVRKSVAFRDAHHAVGSLVTLAVNLGKKLNELSLAELQSVDKRFAADALEVFNLKQALARRELPGAPGTAQVAAQLKQWIRRLDSRTTQGNTAP